MIDEEARAHEVVEVLESVIDPELGIGIISLGLVYRVAVNGDNVDVLMTLTVPGCPMHATITQDVRSNLARIPWTNEIKVDLTFDPPWTVDRMSEGARQALGHA